LGVDGFAPVLPSSIYLDESRQLLQQKAENVLKKCEEMAKKSGVQYQTEKLEGSPVEVLSNRSTIVDMIVLGAHGEFAKWGRSKLMGATVEAISRECIKPIFISQKEFAEIRKILVPYDGSLNSNRALPYAAYFASQFGAEVTVFTVDNNLEVARNIAREGVDYFQAYEISPAIEVRRGHADDEIINFSDEQHFHLIIMGAYGHSRIREAILGSTTERVMRNARIPLLLVK